MRLSYRIAGMAEGTEETRLETLNRNPLKTEKEVEEYFRLADVFAVGDNLNIIFGQLDKSSDGVPPSILLNSTIRSIQYAERN